MNTIPKTVTVGVAEDQQIFRKGLVLLLNELENVQVIIEAENGSVLLDRMKETCPDIVILDYDMPIVSGIEASRFIRKMYPSVKIIILSMYESENYVESAIENGANGYLSKDDDLYELEYAIQMVMENNYYINDRVSKIFINDLMLKGKIKPSFLYNNIEFSHTEIKILNLISKELTTSEIAIELSKSQRTIEKYRTKMMEKVGAHNSIGLVMYGVKNNIIKW